MPSTQELPDPFALTRPIVEIAGPNPIRSAHAVQFAARNPLGVTDRPLDPLESFMSVLGHNSGRPQVLKLARHNRYGSGPTDRRHALT